MARRGLQADLNGDPLDFYECLVRGMQAAPASRAADATDVVAADTTATDAADADAGTVSSSAAPTHHTALVNALRAYLASSGTRQYQAAESMGLSTGAISQWVIGARDIASKMDIEAARASRRAKLDVLVANFLAGLDAGSIPPDDYAAVAPHLADPAGIPARFAALDTEHAAALADAATVINLTHSDGEGRVASEPAATPAATPAAEPAARSKRSAPAAPQRFSPPARIQSKKTKIPLCHDSECFVRHASQPPASCPSCHRTERLSCSPPVAVLH